MFSLWFRWPNTSKMTITNILKPLRKINRQLKEDKELNVWHLGCYLLGGFLYHVWGLAMVDLQKKKTKCSFQVSLVDNEWTSSTNWQYQLRSRLTRLEATNCVMRSPTGEESRWSHMKQTSCNSLHFYQSVNAGEKKAWRLWSPTLWHCHKFKPWIAGSCCTKFWHSRRSEIQQTHSTSTKKCS